MNRSSFLFGGGGLIVGLIVGFFGANSLNRSQTAQATSAPVATNAALNPQTPNILVKEQPATTNNGGGMLPDVSAAINRADNEPNNFDAQIGAGDLYLRIKGFDRAVQFYERAHRIKPDDYDTLVKLGNTLFDARQFEAAAKWYEQALAKNPNDANVRTDLGITFVERAAPDYERAVREFQTSLKTNPKHEPTLYNLGAAYFKKGDASQAGKTLAELEAVNPSSQLVTRLRQVINEK